MNPAYKYDVVIVGAGISGLSTAILLARKNPKLSIVVLSKGGPTKANTYYAQGGIALTLPDTPGGIENHIQDTLKAGAYRGDQSVASTLIAKSPEVLKFLQSCAIGFDFENGHLEVGLEGGHSVPRILHTKDFTGRSIMEGLYKEVVKFKNIQLQPHLFAKQLRIENHQISGIITLSGEGECPIDTNNVVLAGGGMGALFKHTSNPDNSTGDAISLGLEAKAKMRDLPFIQYHPTFFYRAIGKGFLVSEAVRGEGAILRNEHGEAFMENEHPMKDLAPRDIVARAIQKQIRGHSLPYVKLDISSLNHFEEKFPTITKLAEDAGHPISEGYLPVCPAIHFYIGGIEATAGGKTSIKGLFAMGECASTGFHGANRLASNSLLEGVAMAFVFIEENDFTPRSTNLLPAKGISNFGRFHYANIEMKNALQSIAQDSLGVSIKNVHLKSGLKRLCRLMPKVEQLAEQYPYDLCQLENHNRARVLKAILEESIDQSENIGCFFKEL